MLEVISRSHLNAVNILKHDHEKVKNLFRKFKLTDDQQEKRKIVSRVIRDLKIHATLEEEIFYPAVRREVGKKVMTEADEEHHVAKVLIAELEEMDGSEEHFDAKFAVLMENVRHHIHEEEGQMMPMAKDTDIDMEELRNKILDRKEELQEIGVDEFAEEEMVASMHGRGDSPAMGATVSSRKRKHH